MQEAYCQARFRKLSQRKAYKEAYNADNMKDTTIDNKASKLEKTREVRARLIELQNKVESDNIMTEIELQEFWSSVTRSKENDMKDRIKASELSGRNKKMFVDKVEHSGKMPNIILNK